MWLQRATRAQLWGGGDRISLRALDRLWSACCYLLFSTVSPSGCSELTHTTLRLAWSPLMSHPPLRSTFFWRFAFCCICVKAQRWARLQWCGGSSLSLLLCSPVLPVLRLISLSSPFSTTVCSTPESRCFKRTASGKMYSGRPSTLIKAVNKMKNNSPQQRFE